MLGWILLVPCDCAFSISRRFRDSIKCCLRARAWCLISHQILYVAEKATNLNPENLGIRIQRACISMKTWACDVLFQVSYMFMKPGSAVTSLHSSLPIWYPPFSAFIYLRSDTSGVTLGICYYVIYYTYKCLNIDICLFIMLMHTYMFILIYMNLLYRYMIYVICMLK